jgi:hypothetical protein
MRNNRIWANGGITNGLGNAGLNGYAGNDGQAPDPVFASSDVNQPVIGYSGTCYVTGTPMNLGSSSALPDISFEITGFEQGTAGPGYPNDARPDLIVGDLLTRATALAFLLATSMYRARSPIGAIIARRRSSRCRCCSTSSSRRRAGSRR